MVVEGSVTDINKGSSIEHKPNKAAITQRTKLVSKWDPEHKKQKPKNMSFEPRNATNTFKTVWMQNN